MANKRQRKKNITKKVKAALDHLHITKNTPHNDYARIVNEVLKYSDDNIGKIINTFIISRIERVVNEGPNRYRRLKQHELRPFPDIPRDIKYKRIEPIDLPALEYYPSDTKLMMPRPIDEFSTAFLAIDDDELMVEITQIYTNFMFYVERVRARHCEEGFNDTKAWQARGLYIIATLDGSWKDFIEKTFTQNIGRGLDIMKEVYSEGIAEVLEAALYRYISDKMDGNYDSVSVTINMMKPSPDLIQSVVDDYRTAKQQAYNRGR